METDEAINFSYRQKYVTVCTVQETRNRVKSILRNVLLCVLQCYIDMYLYVLLSLYIGILKLLSQTGCFFSKMSFATDEMSQCVCVLCAKRISLIIAPRMTYLALTSNLNPTSHFNLCMPVSRMFNLVPSVTFG